ncbi:GNAT family N-acetyltransferase [Flagellimonas flava]|uniref:GNAT family N-acetyltransferase n=1 Tax=Flagellimonas flava TaxID=570519 RepID=UPI003D65A79D
MEYIELKDTTYGFAKDFKHDQEIRRSFNKLTEVTFGFNLESWYRNGFWGAYYCPYSILYNNEVISNVSINKIEFEIENKKMTGIQIGTVMTDEKYRHRGLNKFIMENVINEWKDQSDFIYLFANDTVLSFYPKFNFETVDEYQFSKSVKSSSTQPLKKLNMEDKTDIAFLMEAINMSIPISKISMRNNASLIMFYCMSFMKNSIYYIEKFKAVVIAEFEGNTLYLNDVFSKVPLELNDLILAISNKSIDSVVLGFTPWDETGFNKSLIKEGDKLFILKGKFSYFNNNNCMFPVLSHA